jgi:hypothetical protein
VVTFDDALTGAVAVDAAVYAYTTKIVRPLKVVEARSYDPTTGKKSRSCHVAHGLPGAAEQDGDRRHQSGLL